MNNQVDRLKDALKTIWTILKVAFCLLILGVILYINYQQVIILGGLSFLIKIIVGTMLMIGIQYAFSKM